VKGKVMKADPKMVKVGRRTDRRYVCAAEGCEEELNEIVVKNADPFHSAECARAFHGVEILKARRGFTVASSD